MKMFICKYTKQGFSKKSNFKEFYADVTSSKKLENAMLPFRIKPTKPNFKPIWGFFCSKNYKTIIFSKDFLPNY